MYLEPWEAYNEKKKRHHGPSHVQKKNETKWKEIAVRTLKIYVFFPLSVAWVLFGMYTFYHPPPPATAKPLENKCGVLHVLSWEGFCTERENCILLAATW